MKKIMMFGITVAMVSGLAIGGTFIIKGNAKNTKMVEQSPISYSRKEAVLEKYLGGNEKSENVFGRRMSSYDQKMLLAPENIEDYVRDMSFLTEEEKARLIQDEKDTLPIYQEIEKIQEDVAKIEQKILDKHQDVLSNYESVMSEHEELWKKLINEEIAQESTEGTDSLIRASQVLTEGEKQLLLDQEQRLAQLDKKLDVIYQEVDEATKGLSEQMQSLYDKADEIHKKSDAIWDKIFDHEGALEESVEAITY